MADKHACDECKRIREYMESNAALYAYAPLPRLTTAKWKLRQHGESEPDRYLCQKHFLVRLSSARAGSHDTYTLARLR